MPLSNVSKLPDPRVQTGAAPAYRGPPVGEVPNLRDFRSPAEEFARRARVAPMPADVGARLRAMPPADMTGVAERLAPKAAGFGMGAFARGAAALAGPIVGGAQMLMHSGSLNSGEDAELARLRSQSPTIDPPGSVMGYADGGVVGHPDPRRLQSSNYTTDQIDREDLARRNYENARGTLSEQPRMDVLRDEFARTTRALGYNAGAGRGMGVVADPMKGYANGGMFSAAEELEEMRRDARTAQLLRETAPDMSEVEKRLGAPNGDRLRNGPSPQQFSPEDKIRLNPANAGPQRSLGGMPPPESVPSGTGRYAYSPPADTLGNRALNAAKSVGRAVKGLGMGLGAGALYEGGAAASEASARMVANNPEQFNTSIGDDGLAANIILASREGQARREATANADRPTAQQIERTVSGPTPQPGAQQIERLAGFQQEPVAQRPAPAAAARPRAGRAAPTGAPGGMLPQAQSRDEAGFERLISDAQAGRQITTPRGRIGGMDLDAQSEAINAEGRADLGPGGYIMANGTPYIDLAKGNADPEWRKRFDDRQARQNAISDQRPDANEMPVVIKDGLARIGMGTSAPADVYWNAEQAGGRGRAALENYGSRVGQVRDAQFDEAINPGQREQGYKMAQIGAQGDNSARVADIQGASNIYAHRVTADGAVDAAATKQRADIAKESRKPLPESGRKELLDIGSASEASKRLLDTFKPEYGGNYILGDLDNTGRRMVGDKSGQAAWWQALDLAQAEARHKLFGSALTKTELPNWEKTAILPRMNSDEIVKNLTRRAEIEARAVSKLARSYAAGGYNRAEIAELLGPTGAKYLEQPASEVGAGGAKPRAETTSVTIGGKNMQARLAPDGFYYVPRPGAPGKFDKVED